MSRLYPSARRKAIEAVDYASTANCMPVLHLQTLLRWAVVDVTVLETAAEAVLVSLLTGRRNTQRDLACVRVLHALAAKNLAVARFIASHVQDMVSITNGRSYSPTVAEKVRLSCRRLVALWQDTLPQIRVFVEFFGPPLTGTRRIITRTEDQDSMAQEQEPIQLAPEQGALLQASVALRLLVEELGSDIIIPPPPALPAWSQLDGILTRSVSDQALDAIIDAASLLEEFADKHITSAEQALILLTRVAERLGEYCDI